jgi:hypothetical protein
MDAATPARTGIERQRFLGQMIDSAFAGLPMGMLPAIVNHVPSLTVSGPRRHVVDGHRGGLDSSRRYAVQPSSRQGLAIPSTLDVIAAAPYRGA